MEKAFPNSLLSHGCVFSDLTLKRVYNFFIEGENEIAKIYLAKVINCHPTFAFPREILGGLLRKMHKFEAAERVYLEVIKINPQRWYSYKLLGLMLIRKVNLQKELSS